MLRLEALRLLRTRRPLVAVCVLVLFLALMLLGFWTYAETETRGEAEFRYTFENESYFNGLTFALYSFYFGFLMVLPIFAATKPARIEQTTLRARIPARVPTAVSGSPAETVSVSAAKAAWLPPSHRAVQTA